MKIIADSDTPKKVLGLGIVLLKKFISMGLKGKKAVQYLSYNILVNAARNRVIIKLAIAYTLVDPIRKIPVSLGTVSATSQIQLNTIEIYGEGSSEGQPVPLVGGLPTIAVRSDLTITAVTLANTLYAQDTSEGMVRVLEQNTAAARVRVRVDTATSSTFSDISNYAEYIVANTLPADRIYIGTDIDEDGEEIKVVFLPVDTGTQCLADAAATQIHNGVFVNSLGDITVAADVHARSDEVIKYLTHYPHYIIIPLTALATALANDNRYRDKYRNTIVSGRHPSIVQTVTHVFTEPYTTEVHVYAEGGENYQFTIPAEALTGILNNTNGSSEAWQVELTASFTPTNHGIADTQVFLIGDAYTYSNGALSITAELLVFYTSTAIRNTVTPDDMDLGEYISGYHLPYAGVGKLVDMNQQMFNAPVPNVSYVRDTTFIANAAPVEYGELTDDIVQMDIAGTAGIAGGTVITEGVIRTTKRAHFQDQTGFIASEADLRSTVTGTVLTRSAASVTSYDTSHRAEVLYNRCYRVTYILGVFTRVALTNDVESVTTRYENTAQTGDSYSGIVFGDTSFDVTNYAIDTVYVNGERYAYEGFRQGASTYTADVQITPFDSNVVLASSYYDKPLPWMSITPTVTTTAVRFPTYVADKYTPVYVYIDDKVRINGVDVVAAPPVDSTQTDDTTTSVIRGVDATAASAFFELYESTGYLVNGPDTYFERELTTTITLYADNEHRESIINSTTSVHSGNPNVASYIDGGSFLGLAATDKVRYRTAQLERAFIGDVPGYTKEPPTAAVDENVFDDGTLAYGNESGWVEANNNYTATFRDSDIHWLRNNNYYQFRILHWVRKGYKTNGLCIIKRLDPLPIQTTEFAALLLQGVVVQTNETAADAIVRHRQELDALGAVVDDHYTILLNNFASRDIMRIMLLGVRYVEFIPDNGDT